MMLGRRSSIPNLCLFLTFLCVHTVQAFHIFPANHLDNKVTQLKAAKGAPTFQRLLTKMAEKSTDGPDISEVQSSDAPAPVGPYSQAVRVGDVLYCSGQVALDPSTGEMVGDGDVEAETRQALKNLRAVLTAAGTTPSKVVRTTVFLADLADFAKVNVIYAEFFDGPVSPARACVQVAALPKAARVEIDCIVAL
eukprot:CAMPEP_0113564196 /NCGR_PEP_ID=MMETSP0015_2-20120614/21482_1 /TAXON_ID=2838 /ORGANISM="Odontella" /LENGTH=193 /DNA_ID=CAMNT_0000466245 /DNA_START=26 /DNA_END=607 /DNA_ORIENTATION=- /assembly_acc=CAM_ASM_000160